MREKRNALGGLVIHIAEFGIVGDAMLRQKFGPPCGHDGWNSGCWQCRPAMFPSPFQIEQNRRVYKSMRRLARQGVAE